LKKEIKNSENQRYLKKEKKTKEKELFKQLFESFIDGKNLRIIKTEKENKTKKRNNKYRKSRLNTC